MNAQIRKNRNNKYSLHNTSNRNGQHLTDFMIENWLTCLNTNYQKREGKLWTYIYVNNSKAQIEYVFMNSKSKNSAMNCEAYSSFEGVSSDHRIVTAKLQLSLRKNATRTATTKHYDWTLLNNRDIRDKYVIELRNRFETLQEKTEKGTPNDEYENFVEAHLEAASKCTRTKPRIKWRVPWETLVVREYVHSWKLPPKLSEKPNKHKCPKTRKGSISINRNIYKRTDRIHTKSVR